MAEKHKPRKPSPVGLESFDAALRKNLTIAADDPSKLYGDGPRQGNPVQLGPLVIDADDWADKMVARAMQAGDAWIKGVTNPKVEPLAAAVAANDRYKEKMMESLNEDRWVNAMKSVDEALMYDIIKAAGPGAYTGGINSRKAKIKAAIGKLRPKVLALKNTIAAMPSVTDADREARMIAALRGMRTIGKEIKAGR